jgi:AcrR family transcriptional regulator
MSIPYEATGRTQQKGRTRAAMLAATRELLAEGATVTVEKAADRAGVSRTTAYRYFTNHRALVLATYPDLDVTTLLPADAPDDPVARLLIVTERMAQRILEHEPELRAMLRLSLETPTPDRDALPLRQGRAIGWIEDALTPLGDRMTRSARRRLAICIRATLGIEPFVWLVDVAGLSRKAALDLMRGSAHTLLQAALSELAAPPKRRR